MAQSDVFDWLRLQRKKGIDSFFTYKEVRQGMKDAGMIEGLHGVPQDLVCLWKSGFVEANMSGELRDWHAVFRLKKKYTNGN